MPALLATVWQEAEAPEHRAIQLKTWAATRGPGAGRGGRAPSSIPYPSTRAKRRPSGVSGNSVTSRVP